MTPHIRRGDRGAAVADLQRRLQQCLPDHGPEITGHFDDATLDAVLLFQQQRGLPADGVVGAETWAALVEAGYTLGDRLLWQSRTPMRGDDVVELQQRLNQLGFDAGPEDGIYGPISRAAVEDFQANVGMEIDGIVGPRTVAVLRRLHRQHLAEGVGAMVREREAVRRLASRGLVGLRIMVDPARGPDEPGARGAQGTTEAELTWQIGSRLAARLSSLGASTTLSRGPATSPTPSARARLANRLDVDLVLSVAMNSLDLPVARGSAAYYYGSLRFVSEAGKRLATIAQDHVVAAGFVPDCRVHPMNWAILRETRMPTVVVEPGFLTSPEDEKRLLDPAEQDRLTAALVAAVRAYLRV